MRSLADPVAETFGAGAELPTIEVEAELRAPGVTAQLVHFIIPHPTNTIVSQGASFLINMCLTPRPPHARAGYLRRWGPHRFERLGDIFLVPPGEELNFRGGSGRQASLVCEIESEAVSRIIGRDLAWTDAQLASTLDLTSARIRALMLRMTEEVRHPGLACEALIAFLGGQLAIEVGRFCLDVNERPSTGGLAGWRLRLIDERLADSALAPSLGELAQLCNISVRQLTRGFKVSRGCSIGDYVEQRRMEAAKRMLVSGEGVKAIAFALGFSSPSSFTFAFRRAVGSSPSEFRQRQTRALAAS